MHVLMYRTKPVVYGGTTIYFRGIRVTQAILDDLAAKGIKSASEVIVTGCSGEQCACVCVCVCVCVYEYECACVQHVYMHM